MSHSRECIPFCCSQVGDSEQRETKEVIEVFDSEDEQLVTHDSSSSSSTVIKSEPLESRSTASMSDKEEIERQSQDHSIWRWRKNGTKESKLNPKARRVYYRCIQHPHCNARLYLDHQGDETKYTISAYHNHPPPECPPVSESIKQRTKALIKTGLKPAAIHKHLVVESKKLGLSADLVPVLTQIRRWKQYIRSSACPTSQPLDSIRAKHGPGFLLKLETFPNFILIICTT